MSMLQKIEKGIPVPPEGKRIYPWEEMEVGDSFVTRTPFLTSAIASARNASRRYGKKFRARRINDDQIRIWRVE